MAENASPIPLGNIVHTEFISTDTKATRQWLTDVFGTKFEDMSTPRGEYFTFGDPKVGIGGAVRGLMPEESVPYSAPYLSVANLDETIQKAKKAGAKVMVPKMPVPSMGWFAWFQAPGGIIIAAWQDDAKAPAPKG